MHQKVQELLRSYNMIYAVVAHLDTCEIEEIGNKTDLRYTRLVEDTFGDADKVKNLNLFLEGKLLPQVLRQGEVRGILLKPSENKIVGFFFHGTGDAYEAYQMGKEISEKLL